MAKRRTVRAERRAKKKADKKANMDKPKGRSHYALKKAGQRQPSIDNGRRASWFVRERWHLYAERMEEAERMRALAA